MKTLCQIGFMTAFSLLIIGCATNGSTHTNGSPSKHEFKGIKLSVVMKALKTAQLGQSQEIKDHQTGSKYKITPVREFKNDSGQTCYEYEIVITSPCEKGCEMTGKACQSGSSWKPIN